MRNRNLLFHDFLSMLASILRFKIDKKRRKNDVEIGLEFGDGKWRRDAERCERFGGASGRGGGPWNEEFGDSGEESMNNFGGHATPDGGGGSNGLKPPAASPQTFFGWKVVA